MLRHVAGTGSDFVCRRIWIWLLDSEVQRPRRGLDNRHKNHRGTCHAAGCCGVTMRPWIWLVLLLLALRLPKQHTIGKLRLQDQVVLWSFCSLAALIVCRLAAGMMVDQLGTSPYDHSPAGISRNLFQTVPEIITLELVRHFCLGKTWRRKKYIYGIGITLAIWLWRLPWNQIQSITDAKTFGMYLGRYAAPGLGTEVYLTTLSLLGGPGPSILYKVGYVVFEKCFPILPNLQWITEGMTGIIVNLVSVMTVWEHYQSLSKRRKIGAMENQNNVLGVLMLASFSVVMIWFVMGVFPLYPTVILTGSMEPGINPGDVTLIERFTKEQQVYALKEGDVIEFQRDDIVIVHRIQEVLTDEAGNISFCTKGDNNPEADVRIVKASEVRGMYKGVVPWVGLLSYWIREAGGKLQTGHDF